MSRDELQFFKAKHHAMMEKYYALKSHGILGRAGGPSKISRPNASAEMLLQWIRELDAKVLFLIWKDAPLVFERALRKSGLVDVLIYLRASMPKSEL